MVFSVIFYPASPQAVIPRILYFPTERDQLGGGPGPPSYSHNQPNRGSFFCNVLCGQKNTEFDGCFQEHNDTMNNIRFFMNRATSGYTRSLVGEGTAGGA